MFRKFILSFVIASTLVVSAFSGISPASAAVCSTYHNVRAGETLYRISRMYGTTVTVLQGMNNLGTSTRIYAGQSLCVAANHGQPTTPTPTPPSGTAYTVVRGDTLNSIARRYGVSMTVLAQVNGITNVNRIYAGQVITIPDVTIQVQ